MFRILASELGFLLWYIICLGASTMVVSPKKKKIKDFVMKAKLDIVYLFSYKMNASLCYRIFTLLCICMQI